MALLTVLAVFAMKQHGSTTPARDFFYGFMSFVVVILLVSVLITYYSSGTSQASLKATTFATNTVYLNNATTPLYIYAITNGSVSGWLGNSTTPNTLAVSSSGTFVGSGGSLTYNMTSTMVVPPQWYFKFNYTANTIKFRTERTGDTS